MRSAPRRNPLSGALFAVIAAVASIGPLAPAAAARGGGEWSSTGDLAVELRWFPRSAADPDQLEALQLSVVAEPELRWRSDGGRHRWELALFGRADGRDDERGHADLRTAAYRYVGDRYEILAGLGRVFWGVTEARHLVDVINQTDAVEDVDEEEKLGQPMVRLALERPWGRLELFSLPGFRERTFAGVEGRPRPQPVVAAERPLFESGAGTDRVDWAVRWSRAAGAWDLGAHLFRGTGREPSFRPSSDGGELRPVYRRTNQAGVDLQLTRGAWLGKLEALVREGHGDTFGAAVAGFERSFYAVGGTAADLGVLAELLWDDRDANAPPTIYDRDLFLGLRLGANDIAGSSVLAGGIVDLDDGSLFGLVEASRRLGHSFRVELEARIFSSGGPGSDLDAVDRDSFLNVRAGWYW